MRCSQGWGNGGCRKPQRAVAGGLGSSLALLSGITGMLWPLFLKTSEVKSRYKGAHGEIQRSEDLITLGVWLHKTKAER